MSVRVRYEQYPAKMAGPIEMPFGTWARVGPINHVLDGGPDPLMIWGTLGGISCPLKSKERSPLHVR